MHINWDYIKHKTLYNLICRWFGHNYSIKRLKGKQCSRCGKYKSDFIDEGFIWHFRREE